MLSDLYSEEMTGSEFLSNGLYQYAEVEIHAKWFIISWDITVDIRGNDAWWNIKTEWVS